MSDPVITLEEGPSKGRYVIARDGVEAELTFSITTPALRIADHTFVPDAFRGTGAGLALVTRLVEDARARGFKVVPLCPFVKSQALRHPEWADVWA